MPNYQYIICADGFSCARAAQAAYYGTNLIYGPCYYVKNSYGQISVASCPGWTNNWARFSRYGTSKLYCDTGEVMASEGCVAAPPPRKDSVCNTTVGNPVDTTSGMKLEYALDFTTAGPIPLKFERHYRSNTDTMEGYYPNRLGRGWRSNFDAAIHIRSTSTHPSSNIRIVLPDGTFYAFYKSSGVFVQRYYSWSSAIWRSATIDRYAKAAWNSTLQRYELTTDDDTVWSFDTSARLQSIVFRGGYTQTFAYDSAGNNTSVTDSFGRTLTFTYTANGLLDTMRSPDGRIYSYDFLSRYSEEKSASIAATDIDKSFFALEYVTYPDNTSDSADNPRVRYHYENSTYPYALTGITDERAVRYATWSYDSEGRVIRSEHAGSADIHDFSYGGTATTVTNPLGKNSVYHFDTDLQSRNRLTRLEGISSANCAASDGYYAYNSSNFVTQRTDEEGHVTKYTRDTRGNPTEIIEAYGTSDQRTTSIAWDATYDVPTRIVETGRTINLSYDSSGRLTSRTETDTTTQSSPYSTNGETRSWTYSYSSLGLLLSVDGPLQGTGDTTAYAYDASGYLASITDETGLVTTITSVTANGYPATLDGSSSRTLTHDAAGNIIADVRGANVYAYAYDGANHLSEVTKDGVLQASYLYNGFGQLAARTLTAATGLPGTVHYLYDGDGHLIAEADAATGAIAREYLWLDDLPVAVVDGTSLYHVVTDHLYRPVAMFDDTGTEVWSAVWEPFGALHSVTGALTLEARFPGQWYQLETGLHYNWHRHYDPTLGRYTQADPLGMPDGPNRFVYARNNPVMNIDPDGLRLKGGARPTNCKGIPFVRGKDIHKLFEQLALSKNQDLIFNRDPFGFFDGKPDVYAPGTGDTWEIKPTTFGDGSLYSAALGQLHSYINSASHMTIAKSGSWANLFDDAPSVSIRHPYYGNVIFEPDSPSDTGLIFYSCEPPPPVCYPQ